VIDLVIDLVTALRRRHHALLDDRERGTSLIELIVGMGIMTICGAIFLGSAVTLSRVTAKTQAVTTSASQTNLAYLTLDKTVRYASAISLPAKSSSGVWYVEFRDTTSGSEVCTQLRVDNTTQQLQQRTWTTATTPVVPTAFRQVSPGFTNGAAAASSSTTLNTTDQPFFRLPDSTTANHQRLSITLISAAGAASGTSSTSRSAFTLTGLNSTTNAAAGTICQQAGRP
jgi:type II secretory pathway pseudopilin PulG